MDHHKETPKSDARSRRWTDNPFAPMNPTPEQQAWFDKRDEALRRFHETGDDSLAIEIGLFPSPEEEEKLRRENEENQSSIDCGSSA